MPNDAAERYLQKPCEPQGCANQLALGNAHRLPHSDCLKMNVRQALHSGFGEPRSMAQTQLFCLDAMASQHANATSTNLVFKDDYTGTTNARKD